MFRMILLPLLLAMSSNVHAQSVRITPGDGFEVERYAVALRPDLATTAVSGTETIVVRGTSDRVTQLAVNTNCVTRSDVPRTTIVSVPETAVVARSGRSATA